MANVANETAVTLEEVAKWYKLKKKLAEIKGAEAMLRSRIFKHYVPKPVEGMNTVPLNDGTGAELKASHVINRDIDEGELDALRAAIQEQEESKTKDSEEELPEFEFDKLIRWKPSLVKAEYNKLSDNERSVFDRILIVKPGAPTVDIKIPKSPK